MIRKYSCKEANPKDIPPPQQKKSIYLFGAKQEVIDSYSELLSSEILDVYSEKIAEYSAENLDKELAYELKKSNPAFYSKQDTAYLPKDEPKGGLEELLMKYSK